MDEHITNATLRTIRRIFRAADRGGRRLAVATGLTTSQMLVLQQLDRNGETTPSAIAATLQFGQATVTNLVDRLEAAGLATRRRSERDKRQMLINITDQGREMLNIAPDLLQEQFRGKFNRLALWEQAMLLSALERVAELLDASDIDAAPLIDSGAIDRSVDPSEQ